MIERKKVKMIHKIVKTRTLEHEPAKTHFFYSPDLNITGFERFILHKDKPESLHIIREWRGKYVTQEVAFFKLETFVKWMKFLFDISGRVA